MRIHVFTVSMLNKIKCKWPWKGIKIIILTCVLCIEEASNIITTLVPCDQFNRCVSWREQVSIWTNIEVELDPSSVCVIVRVFIHVGIIEILNQFKQGVWESWVSRYILTCHYRWIIVKEAQSKRRWKKWERTNFVSNKSLFDRNKFVSHTYNGIKPSHAV